MGRSPALVLALVGWVLAAGVTHAQVLTEIRRQKRPTILTATDWPAVSPDQRWLGAFSGPSLDILSLDRLAKVRSANVSNESLLKFGFDGPLSLRWSETSDSVWAAVWPWPDGKQEAVTVGLDGAIHKVVDPGGVMGPLGGILYVNGRGLAVAAYGAAGRFNNTLSAPATLALVDFQAGSTLATLKLDAPLPVVSAQPLRLGHLSITYADAVQLLGGVVRFAAAVESSQQWWLLWDSDRGARLFRKKNGWALDRHALTPDGSRLLAARSLQASSPCPFDSRCDKPRTPDKGPSFIMYDAGDGRELWRRHEGRVYYLRPARPVFSADGRFAIVALPTFRDTGKGRIGVISTANGKLVGAAEIASDVPSLQILSDGRTLVVNTIHDMEVFAIDWDAAGAARGRPAMRTAARGKRRCA